VGVHDDVLRFNLTPEHSRRDVEILRNLAGTVALGGNLREIHADVLKNIVDLMRGSAGYIYLVDKEQKLIYLSAEYCDTAAPLPAKAECVKLDKHSYLPIQQVIQSGKGKIIDNIFGDEKLVQSLIPFVWPMKFCTSAVIAPLRIGKENPGALCVSAQKERMFNEEDILLLESVGNVLGVVLFNNRLLDELQGRKENSTTDREPLKMTLSKREYEVFILTIKGFTCREIGQQLFLSVRTVETYKQRIMEKLHLNHKYELVEYALKNKIL
jgi:DNA-binding CsgD family transcriptional regulator